MCWGVEPSNISETVLINRSLVEIPLVAIRPFYARCHDQRQIH
jgi:hypothetical protein